MSIEKNPDAADIVMRLNRGMKMVPTLDVEGTIVVGGKFDPETFEGGLRNTGVL